MEQSRIFSTQDEEEQKQGGLHQTQASRNQNAQVEKKLRENMNKWEWTPDLDKSLQEIVLRNYFNFDMVSVELNEEAKRLGLNFGATHVFTNEKCRIRWSYLHLKRQTGKDVKYKSKSSTTSTAASTRQHQQQPQRPQLVSRSAGTTAAEESISEPPKDIKGIDINIKSNKVNLGNLESHLWKKNITIGPRKNKDYLDVSQEDFTQNKSLSIEGKEITPSNFNIFRDSLRLTSEKLLQTLQENLPDMNLKEIEENTDREQNSEDDDDDNVVPLDFRTAMIEEQNKVVIQAKPLSLKTDDELLREASMPYKEFELKKDFDSVDSYLDAVKKEPFKQDEGDVLLIDPDINIKEKFDRIDLACNQEQRINNAFNAPIRTKEQIAMDALAQSLLQQQQQQSKMQPPKVASKQYETDTDNELNEAEQLKDTSTEQKETEPSKDDMPHGYKKENLDFNNILKQFDLSDLNKMIGMSSGSEDESKRKQKQQAKSTKEESKGSSGREPLAQIDKALASYTKSQHQPAKPTTTASIGQRVGLIESIMSENRQAQQKMKDAENQPFSIDQMLNNLKDEATKLLQQQSEEDSDVAPMSPLVDTPSKEELKKQEMKKAERSLKMASSASEGEESGKESKKQKRRVHFEDDKESKQVDEEEGEEEMEMIDTTTAPSSTKKKSKSQQKKVITYKGVKIQSEDENSGKSDGSSSQNDSAEEYFNQQRKLIKKKLIGGNLQNEFDQEDLLAGDAPPQNYSGGNYTFDDEESKEFDSLRKRSASEEEDETTRAQQEQERLRLERLRQQEEHLRMEQERKQKERDELMDRVKKQDEERKRRKKEEKAKREQDKEMKRQIEEERLQREQEELDRVAEAERQKRLEEDRLKREKDENERRKETFERSIKKIWNGSDIPCLFDQKIAYTRPLYALPVNLEEMILKNQVPNEDLMFRRYKVLLIPIDTLLGRTSANPLIELTNYFLRYSTINLIDIRPQQQEGSRLKTFPFKCIGFVQSVAVPPFNKCSLSAIYHPSESPNAQRVLTLLFDTHDHPKTKTNFNETLKSTKLSDIVSEQSLQEIASVYPQFLEKLAQDYIQANKVKDFPYPINMKVSPLIAFENPRDVIFKDKDETLSRIAFFMEYSVQDDTVPMATKESWEFLRRYPTFYAYNPNAKSYSRIDSRGKLLTKYNQYHTENVCVIFKDLTFGQVEQKEAHTNSQDSLSFFLKKALIQGGLEICGMRMIYIDSDQVSLYEHLFNEKLKLSSNNNEGSSLFALFLRGLDAISKCEQIIGHFNPDMARKTNEKSVRAFFGQDKEQRNCVLKMFASQKKNMSELIFWFGGRVQQEGSTQEILSQSSQLVQQVPVSTMYLVVPPKVEKQILFLSPLITARELPGILQILTEFGVTILDLQRINYEKLQYEGEGIQQGLNRNLALFRVRGSILQIPIGFVLKVAKEGLVQKYISRINKLLDKQLQHIDRNFGTSSSSETSQGLLYLTSTLKEYKVVKSKLKQSIFNVNYSQLQIEHLQPKKHIKSATSGQEHQPTDYDSEDTENYREITLFEQPSVPSQSPQKKLQMIKKGGASSHLQNAQDSYETHSFMCFMKVSVFRKQTIKDMLTEILSHFELIGVKIINAKQEIYSELIPVNIRTLFKKIAYKFYENQPDLRLRKKITEFKTLVLVLRGRNVENTLGKFYDKERLQFLNSDISSFEGLPQAIFLNNQTLLEPMFDFLLNTKMIKLYNDFAIAHEHLMDSPVYSYLLHHNVDRIDPVTATQISDPAIASTALSVSNIVQIKTKDQLQDSQDGSSKLSGCVVVVKPNQSLNVALRTLKSIANNKELGLQIQNLEVTRYTDKQIDLLYKHDIDYDELIPQHLKPSMHKHFLDLFTPQQSVVVQFVVTGPYAIAKIKQIIGHRDPKLALKDSMRSFYGVDRVDNAYFISENFSESLIERDFLFSQEEGCGGYAMMTPAQLQALGSQQQVNKVIKLKQPTISPATSLASLNQPELALLLIGPQIVGTNEFVFVLDDLYRQKFNICAVLRLPQSHVMERADLDQLFQEMAPRMVNIDIIEGLFKQEGGCVLAVVEKQQKTVQELSEVVGKIEIKSKADIDKILKKKQSNSSMMFAGGYPGGEQLSLIQEYGPYIFSFPIGGAQANQKKILRYFNSLPNSQYFEIENTSQLEQQTE